VSLIRKEIVWFNDVNKNLLKKRHSIYDRDELRNKNGEAAVKAAEYINTKALNSRILVDKKSEFLLYGNEYAYSLNTNYGTSYRL
jgi:hypothetical protein